MDLSKSIPTKKIFEKLSIGGQNFFEKTAMSLKRNFNGKNFQNRHFEVGASIRTYCEGVLLIVIMQFLIHLFLVTSHKTLLHLELVPHYYNVNISKENPPVNLLCGGARLYKSRNLWIHLLLVTFITFGASPTSL